MHASALRSRGAALALAVLLSPARASADEATAIAARSLAEDGLRAVREGRDDEGCPKLFEAWRLDTTLLGAGFAAAGCHERRGQLASAWADYASVAGKAEARHDARADEARAHADALKPRLSTLTIVVPAPLAALEGLRVERDHAPVGAVMFGVAVPIDGGTYTISVSASGRRQRSSTVEVPPEGGKVELIVEEPPLLEPVEPPPPSAPPPRLEAPTKLGGLGIAAIVLGATGAIGLGVGVGLGVQAEADYSSVTGCLGNVCDPSSAATRRSALGLADAGTGTFIAGAVLGATSIVLGVIAATSARPSTDGISLTPRGFAF